MKKVISTLVVASMLVPTAVFATETTPEQKTLRTEFKQQIVSKKQEVKSLRDNNQSIREQIKQKRQEIKTKVQELKKNKDEGSKAKLTQVKNQFQNLSTSKEALKELRGAGKPFWEQLKLNVKNMNVEGALVNLDSISGLRTSRNESLVKINSTLDAILNILK
jgi:uncharacterized protein (DUF3084 family)